MKYALVLLMALGIGGGVSAQKGHSIQIHLKHLHQGKLYLGNYYGQNTYLIDSVSISPSGIAVFKGKDTLPGGIYFILYPRKQRYFELLIDQDQHFKINADTTAHFKNLSFENSEDNVLFRDYNAFLNQQQEQIAAARRAGKDSVTIAAIQRQVGKNIQNYREKIIKQHPHRLLAALFRVMQDPQVPEKPKGNTDTSYAYHYFRAHYWDAVNFSDSRIVRTPLLETRLQRYFTQLVPPVPDSVNQAADQLLARAKANKGVFKYILWWLTSTYEKSPYMGMDAVFVHLVEQYYVTGEAYWVKEDQLKKIIDKASKIAPNLIGNTAPKLSLETIDLKPVTLSDIQSRFTILVFWDPTCGHCKIVVPKLDSAYENEWKSKGVKMVGVLSGGNKKQWTDFIETHQLNDWINLWDPEGNSTYRQLYDVYMTPVVYLLDKNKKILAKQLNVKQLNAFLTRLTSTKKGT